MEHSLAVVTVRVRRAVLVDTLGLAVVPDGARDEDGPAAGITTRCCKQLDLAAGGAPLRKQQTTTLPQAISRKPRRTFITSGPATIRFTPAYSQAMPSTEVTDFAREPITSLASPKMRRNFGSLGANLSLGQNDTSTYRTGWLTGRVERPARERTPLIDALERFRQDPILAIRFRGLAPGFVATGHAGLEISRSRCNLIVDDPDYGRPASYLAGSVSPRSQKTSCSGRRFFVAGERNLTMTSDGPLRWASPMTYPRSSNAGASGGARPASTRSTSIP